MFQYSMSSWQGAMYFEQRFCQQSCFEPNISCSKPRLLYYSPLLCFAVPSVIIYCVHYLMVKSLDMHILLQSFVIIFSVVCPICASVQNKECYNLALKKNDLLKNVDFRMMNGNNSESGHLLLQYHFIY